MANSDPRQDTQETKLQSLERIPLEFTAIAGSISSSGRDAVLLSLQGLHIFDLDRPSKTPWTLIDDVPGTPTDVQWHPSTYKPSTIFSTIGSRLLLWDLQQAIIHAPSYRTLKSHERAITCVDGSSKHPEIAATCGLDGHICIWDIRSHQRPVKKLYDDGLSVHKVRLSPLNGDIFASVHGSRYYVWDLRHTSEPVKAIKAHTNRVRDLQWNPQFNDSILTCSSDRTVKFWNWSRARGDENQAESAGGTEALDRTLETSSALENALHTPVGQGVLASGHDLFLFDCRTRAISDRKAKIAPVHRWGLGEYRVRSMGLRKTHDASLQFLSVVDNTLCIVPLSSALLESVGADAQSMYASSPVPKLKPGSYRNHAESKEHSSTERWCYSALMRPDMGGVIRFKGEGLPKRLSNTQSDGGARHVANEGEEVAKARVCAPPPTVTATENLNSMDDEDDDLAVISGDLTASELNPDRSRIIITPPPRLAGATFAPSGSLVIFSSSHINLNSPASPEEIPNYHGIAQLLFDRVDEADFDMTEPLIDFGSVLFSRNKGFPSWYSRRSDWVGERGNDDSADRGKSAPAGEAITDNVGTSLEHVPKCHLQVAIKKVDDFLPAKRRLAEEYTLQGSPHSICEHNKAVCEKYGFDQHAKAWGHAAMILKPVVPLQASSSGNGELVVAKRNLVEIKRRDGRGNAIGVDYAFDEPLHVIKPLVWAPVQWDSHPFGQQFVKKMLQTFESLRDAQMLAMLTYVFALETPKYKQHDTPKMIESGSVRIKLKGKQHSRASNADTVGTVPILDPKDFDQHCAWRQNYADQLYAWGMTFARLEMLQHNGTKTKMTTADRETKVGLLPVGEVEEGPVARCMICWEVIQGLCVTCPDCTHSTHLACSEAWAQEQSSDLPCTAGCGCVCERMDA